VRVHAVSRPQEPRLSVTLAYDAIAAGYDAQVRGDDWMRRVLHARYHGAFRSGQRVLDVGCGTGIDAVALAGMGVRVLGIDGSAGMIDRLRDKVASAQLEALIETRVLGIQELGALGNQRFDGLISAFASLSSLPDLRGFANDAARLVRPGGRVVLHLLNRFSLWEWLGHVSKGELGAAVTVGRQSVREFVIGGQSVRHTLYFADDAYRRFFTRSFVLREAFCLGTLRPPHTVRRLPPGVVGSLEWLDVRLGGWPLLNRAGRFFVLDLQRRGSA
jgi:ubiquinone/menaquinone biosynthesis C-methylase UbiE